MLLKRTGGIQNGAVEHESSKETVFNGVGRNADYVDRHEKKSEDHKKSLKHAEELARYEVDELHREEKRQKQELEKQNPNYAIHSHTDEARTHRGNEKGGTNIDLSDSKVQILVTAILILLIVGIAVLAFVFIANQSFKKQSELLEKQESELVYLRRLSQSEKHMEGRTASPGTASEGNLIDPSKRKEEIDLEKGKGKFAKFNDEQE